MYFTEQVWTNLKLNKHFYEQTFEKSTPQDSRHIAKGISKHQGYHRYQHPACHILEDKSNKHGRLNNTILFVITNDVNHLSYP